MTELAETLTDTRLVYVADRELAMIELMGRAWELGNTAAWLRRSPHNRALPEGGKLWAQVLESESLGEIRFTLPRIERR